MKKFMCMLIFCVTLFSAQFSYASSTKIGNGGDIVDKFLENTRYTLKMALENIEYFNTTSICNAVARLNASEKDYCNNKFLELRTALQDKLNENPPIAFKLSITPLYVDLPDGTKRQVLARTNCGADGEIMFDYNGIKQLSPSQMYALMAHEFIHKVPFEGRECLQDSDEPGVFTGYDGGRKFIDALAEALTKAAVAKGFLGKEFGIEDEFFCEISEPASGFEFPSYPKAPRSFLIKKELGQYLTGVGNFPKDPECSMTENQGRSKVTFRLRIQELNNCEAPEQTNARSSQWQLLREFTPIANNSANTPNPVILNQATFLGLNPLCSWQIEPVDFTTNFSTADGRIFTFKLRYQSSYAVKNYEF